MAVFHRVIKDFMIQGGDPLTKTRAKRAPGAPGRSGYKVKAEFNDVITIAACYPWPARRSRFSRHQFLSAMAPEVFLDHQYTAFGKLIQRR